MTVVTTTDVQATLRATSLHLACLRHQLQHTRAELRHVRELVERSSPPPPTARRLTLVSPPNDDTPKEATLTMQADKVDRMAPVIAIIDDDPALVALLGELLEEEGYRVLTGDGRLDPPALRGAPATDGVPVLVCTADTQVVREQGGRWAMDGVVALAKPFELDELLARVAMLVNGPPAGRAASP